MTDHEHNVIKLGHGLIGIANGYTAGDPSEIERNVLLYLADAPHQVAEHKGPPVANVGEVIDRRPAAVEADRLAGRVQGDKLLHRAGQGIEQL